MLKDVVRNISNNEAFSFNKLFIGNFKIIVLNIVCILISKCSLIAGVNPFGIAILGAIASNGIPILVSLFLVAITTLVCFGWLALLKFVISVVVFASLKAFIKYGEHRTGEVAKIMLSVAVAETVGLLIGDSLLYDCMLTIYATLTSGIFYLIFVEGLEPILNVDEEKIYSSENLLAMGIVLAVTISGLGNIAIFNISIRGIISVLIVLLLGWKRGVAVGAASGIAISIVLALIGIGNMSTIATYGFCGLLAGVFSRFGKLGAAIGFIIGNIILAFYASGSTEIIISIKEIIVASVVLFLIPRNATVFLDNLFDYDRSIQEPNKIGLFPKTTIYRLNAVSDVINNIAKNAENDPNSILCINDNIGEFIKTLNDNTCKRCEHYNKCWKQNYHNMYETIFNCVEHLKNNGEISEKEIQSEVCEKKDLLAEGLNFSYQIHKVNQNWQEKLKEKKTQISKQLKGVSKAINYIKNDVNGKEEEQLAKDSNFSIEIGMSKTKKSDSSISGDNTIMVKLKDGRYLFGVSDGMGSGEEANNNSRQVIEMLEKLLNSGFNKDDALELVNSVLIFNNDDSFATLDISMFDANTGNTEFIKVSACPTYIKKNKSVDIVQSVSLPIGILNDADIDLYDKVLEDGDMIIMVTDGVLEANCDESEKGKWILDLLKSINPEKPQRLADIILQEAIDANFGAVHDDMTVIVAKVRKSRV